MQLTTKPLLFYQAVPSLDGKKLFVEAIQPRAQAVRRDVTSGQFVPFLSGISATDFAFSSAGQWAAYVSIPDGSLWRSRMDGSERLQLTFPPTIAMLPVWSSDGSSIAYSSLSKGEARKARIISSQGGSAEDLLPSGAGGVDFTIHHSIPTLDCAIRPATGADLSHPGGFPQRRRIPLIFGNGEAQPASVRRKTQIIE